VPQHARLSPSAIRWLTCPASPDAEAALPPNASSLAANTGSLQHAWLELALRLNLASVDWIAEPEHRQQVQVALDAVNGLLRRHPQAKLLIEERLGPPAWRPQADLFGTADVVASSPYLLAILDAKFGTHAVEATSPQLLTYLALAVERYGSRPLMLTMVVQPRLARKLRIHAWSCEQVMTFTETLKMAAAATDNPCAPRVANEHCWFCRARPECPEIVALEERRAMAELDAAMQSAV
jgi:hypothetical protein